MDSDEAIVGLLESCDEYVTVQGNVEKLIRDGFFQMAMARKNSPQSSLDNCRHELESSVSVALVDDNFVLSKDDTTNSILIISPLPPRALRRAEESFRNALKEVVRLANTAKSIGEKMDALK